MVNSLRSAAYLVAQTRYVPSLSNPIPTNNTKNALKVNLQSDLSQHGVSLINGGRLLLPVIHHGVQRVERGASSVLIDREVGITATLKVSPFPYKSPRIATASFFVLAGMSCAARFMRWREDASSTSSTMAILNMFAWKCDRFAIGVNTPYYRSPAAAATHHAERSHLHVVRAALREREQLVVVSHEAVLVDDHVQRLVQRLRLQQPARHEVAAPAVHV